MNRFTYIGDTNLEHGGFFFEIPDDFEQDYADSLEVTDLDSGAGYAGALLIESGNVYLDKVDSKRLRSALPTVGAKLLANGDIDDNGTLRKRGTFEHWRCRVYAVKAYGGIEDAFTEVVSFDPDTPDSFDGWEVERLDPTSDIATYVSDSYGVSYSEAEWPD